MAAESGSGEAAAAAAAAATDASPEEEGVRAASIVGLEERDSARLHGGVVIPNPSYIVKELVENALDAGASLIAVRLKVTAAEGIAEVEVQDNGCGVAGPYDRLACAGCTSKDSGAAGSAHYGFRGYALSAVRSQCGCMVVRTRRDNESWQVTLRGGEEAAAVEPLPGHRLSGTKVTVTSPFAQAPVRQRYWAEKARVKRELALTQYHVLSLSVANPGVTIMLHRDGVPMSAVKKADRPTEPAPDTLRGSVAAAVGRRVYAALDEVSAASADGSVAATVFLPKIGAAGEAATRSSDDRIITVLNRRPVKWKQAVATAREHHALARSPGAASGREPVLIISVTMPDADVDLNLCPHKQYAAFRDEASALDAVASALSNQDGFPADNGWCPRGRNGLASSQAPLSSSPSQQDGGSGGGHPSSPGASSAGLSQSAKQNLGDLASSLFLTEQGGGLSGAATTFHEYQPDSGSEEGGEGEGEGDCDTGGRRAAEYNESGSEADSEDEAASARAQREPPTPAPAAKRVRLQAVAEKEKTSCVRAPQADARSVPPPPPSPRCRTPPPDEPAARRRASSLSASPASAIDGRPRRTPRTAKAAGRAAPPDALRPTPAPSVEDISGVFQRMFKQQSQAAEHAEGKEATAEEPCGGGSGSGGGEVVVSSATTEAPREVVRGVATPPPEVLLCTPVETTTAPSQPPPSKEAEAALPPAAQSSSFLKGFRTEAGCVALPSADIAGDLHAAAHDMLRRSTRVESSRQDVRVGGHAAQDACALAATLLRCDVSVVGFLDDVPAGAGASTSLAVAEASRRRGSSAAAAGDEWTTVFCFDPRRLHCAAVLAGLSATHRLSTQPLDQPVVLRHWRGPAGEAFAESQLRLLVRVAKAWGGREASGFKVAVTTSVPCGAAGGEVVLTHLHDGGVVPGFGIRDVFEAAQLAAAHDEEDARSVLRCTRGRAALAEMARLEADRVYGSGCVEAPSVQAHRTLLLALETHALEQQMKPLLFPLCSVR